MNELDSPLVKSFEEASVDPKTFGHREHLHIAWCYLRAMPLEDALARYVRHLRALTVTLGVPHKFHRTATWAWVLLLDEAMRASPDRDFDTLLASSPHLLSRDALLTVYRREVLESDAARARYVAPDGR